MRPIWLVIFGMGTLLLRAGFAMQASGSLRAKNAAGAVLRLIADMAAATLAFWAVGASILFQNHNSWFAVDTRLLFGETPDLAATEFFHMTLCVIGGAIVTGALAERSKFYVSVITSAVLAGIVFPVAGHWIWFGKLKDWNFIDYGGAAVIHLSAAVFAAIGIAMVGSRTGKYAAGQSSASIGGHAIPMMTVGVLLLLVGWFPYLLGCVVAHWAALSLLDDVVMGVAATNILLAGMGGAAGGLIYSQFRYGKPDLFFTCSGLLGGLVAISSGLAGVSSGGAMVIGLFAGVLVPLAAMMLDGSARLDDPIGLIAIHGIGAIWGTLATAMFVSTLDFSDHFRLLATQCLGLAMVIALAMVVALAVYAGLKLMGPLRVIAADEAEGLDLADHGVKSYPEFDTSV